jgi:hypothetical protein
VTIPSDVIVIKGETVAALVYRAFVPTVSAVVSNGPAVVDAAVAVFGV